MFSWIKAHYEARKANNLVDRTFKLERDLKKFIAEQNPIVVGLVMLSINKSFDNINDCAKMQFEETLKEIEEKKRNKEVK